MNESNPWKADVCAALEAARMEVIRRLDAHQLPHSVRVMRLVIIGRPDGNGWQSEWREQEVSTLNDASATAAIADDSVPYRQYGLREQLEPLAHRLADESNLAQRPSPLLPGLDGVEAILTRYLVNLASYYLCRLRSVDESNSELIDQLAAELRDLARESHLRRNWQMSVGGILPATGYRYRDVGLRPLTEWERGEVFHAHQGRLLTQRVPLADSNLVTSSGMSMFEPTALLEITTHRPRDAQLDESRLILRVLLGLFLLGYDLSGDGVATAFDEPEWANMGISSTPVPLHERFVHDKDISEEDFRAAVDLAYKMPEFGTESNSREIVLSRLLRGCGAEWHESGFLDFAIALEAALLGGARTELAYRFKLYGSLFLSPERNANTTFRDLATVYSVRSDLVHGTPVKAARRVNAEKVAKDLAIAVVRKALETTWPDQKALDSMALE